MLLHHGHFVLFLLLGVLWVGYVGDPYRGEVALLSDELSSLFLAHALRALPDHLLVVLDLNRLQLLDTLLLALPFLKVLFGLAGVTNAVRFLDVPQFELVQLRGKLYFSPVAVGAGLLLLEGRLLGHSLQLGHHFLVATLREARHQILLVLLFVLAFFVVDFLSGLAALNHGQSQVVLPLDVVDELGVLVNAVLVVFKLLHHRRANVVELAHRGLFQSLRAFEVLRLLHRLVELFFEHVLFLFALALGSEQLLFKVNHVLGELQLVLIPLLAHRLLALAIFQVFLSLVHLSELAAHIGSLLGDLALHLLVTIAPELVEHIPQVHFLQAWLGPATVFFEEPVKFLFVAAFSSEVIHLPLAALLGLIGVIVTDDAVVQVGVAV